MGHRGYARYYTGPLPEIGFLINDAQYYYWGWIEYLLILKLTHVFSYATLHLIWASFVPCFCADPFVIVLKNFIRRHFRKFILGRLVVRHCAGFCQNNYCLFGNVLRLAPAQKRRNTLQPFLLWHSLYPLLPAWNYKNWYGYSFGFLAISRNQIWRSTSNTLLWPY